MSGDGLKLGPVANERAAQWPRPHSAECRSLARLIFSAPTRFYKTDIVFLAWFNGHQTHFRMVAGLENARSIIHLAELFCLADAASVLHDPALATHRMRLLLKVAGVT